MSNVLFEVTILKSDSGLIEKIDNVQKLSGNGHDVLYGFKWVVKNVFIRQ